MKILECKLNQFKCWLLKENKKSKKLIIILPEYYSDALEKMRKNIKKYKVLNDTDFIDASNSLYSSIANNLSSEVLPPKTNLKAFPIFVI